MKINFFEHNLSGKVIKKVFRSNYLTSGPVCRKFEKVISKQFQKKHCLLTNSWTNGLIGILKSLNLKKKHEIIIPSLTYVACANVIELSGAKVVFADVEKDTLLLSIDDCVKKINKNTKAIMPVHLYGNIFDTSKLKKKINRKIKIIEDCAHIFNGYYTNNKPIGFYSDYAVFSFYATKNITTGEGGAIITNEENIKKVKSILNNGMTASAHNRFTGNKYNPWDVFQPGFKGNLSDINASLLEFQIKKEKQNTNKRIKLYNLYKEKISKYIQIPLSSKFKFRDFHLFPIGLNSKKERDYVMKELFKKKNSGNCKL